MCRISRPMGLDRIACLPLRREPPDHKWHIVAHSLHSLEACDVSSKRVPTQWNGYRYCQSVYGTVRVCQTNNNTWTTYKATAKSAVFNLTTSLRCSSEKQCLAPGQDVPSIERNISGQSTLTTFFTKRYDEKQTVSMIYQINVFAWEPHMTKV